MNIDQSAMCYTSMDSSLRALQINKKNLISIIGRKPKNIQKGSEASILIKIIFDSELLILSFELKFFVCRHVSM